VRPGSSRGDTIVTALQRGQRLWLEIAGATCRSVPRQGLGRLQTASARTKLPPAMQRTTAMLDRPAELKKYQTFIDGKWVDAASGKTFQTFDPYTGEPWALIPECDKADVDLAVEAAARAFETQIYDG
jgi:Aldehyde dehydrogenase family